VVYFFGNRPTHPTNPTSIPVSTEERVENTQARLVVQTEKKKKRRTSYRCRRSEEVKGWKVVRRRRVERRKG